MQVFATATAGIVAANDRFSASAQRTAAAPLENLAAETVERVTAGVALKANVAVLKTADELYGSLLDILA